MEITIRNWNTDDVSLIGALWLEAYGEIRRSGDPDLKPNARLGLERWLRDRWRDRSHLGYAAEADGVFAGFLLGQMGIWESEPPILRTRKLALIDAVYVVERFRRAGVASALVERAVEFARISGAAGVETTYEADAGGAAGFWQEMGFDQAFVRTIRPLGGSGSGSIRKDLG